MKRGKWRGEEQFDCSIVGYCMFALDYRAEGVRRGLHYFEMF